MGVFWGLAFNSSKHIGFLMTMSRYVTVCTVIGMGPYVVGVIVPIVLALLLQSSKKGKKRGLPVDVGGQPGFAIRNSRFTSPFESSQAGISTLAELFEHSCKQHHDKKFLGTRRLLSSEVEVSEDGRSIW